MKVFVLICSAHKYKSRRDGIRETWLPRLMPYMTYRFYVGAGPQPADEPDVVVVDTVDTWAGLTHKIQAAFQHSLQFEYDWLFKVDDDTYFVPERLPRIFETCQLAPCYPAHPELGETRAPRRTEPDYIGTFGGKKECYGLGCGYVLKRRWVEKLVKCPKEEDLLDSEDGWVGKHCRDWTRFYYTELIHHQSSWEWPKPDNEVVSCHEVRTKERMLRMHRYFLGLEQPVATPAPPMI